MASQMEGQDVVTTSIGGGDQEGQILITPDLWMERKGMQGGGGCKRKKEGKLRSLDQKRPKEDLSETRSEGKERMASEKDIKLEPQWSEQVNSSTDKTPQPKAGIQWHAVARSTERKEKLYETWKGSAVVSEKPHGGGRTTEKSRHSHSQDSNSSASASLVSPKSDLGRGGGSSSVPQHPNPFPGLTAGLPTPSNPFLFPPLLSRLPGCIPTSMGESLPPMPSLGTLGFGQRESASHTNQSGGAAVAAAAAAAAMPGLLAPPVGSNPSSGLLGNLGNMIPQLSGFPNPAFSLPNQPLLPGGMGSLLPPNTLLVPYPVVLPLPLPFPVPLPIPIPVDLANCKLTELNQSGSTESQSRPDSTGASSTTSSNRNTTNQGLASPVRSNSLTSPIRSGQVSDAPTLRIKTEVRDMLPGGTVPPGETSVEVSETDKAKSGAGRITCACCQGPAGNGQCSKAEHSTENNPVLLDYTPFGACLPAQEDAIDLSAKDKHSTSVVNGATETLRNSRVPVPSSSQSPTLSDSMQPAFSLPSIVGGMGSNYSARRNRILDAPCIPKENRLKTSGFEKRSFTPNASRDYLYGKRRCMRHRARPKAGLLEHIKQN